MLILSRRENDRVVFPNLGITVHVTRIEGRTVRLGIEAPRDVPVLRHEIAESWTNWKDYPLGEKPQKLSHALRNRLQSATLALHILHRQMEDGQFDQVEPTVLRIFRELESMEQEVSKLSHEPRDRQFEGPLRRALLVEDDENESELLAGCLRLCNFEVVTAKDGVDALKYLSSNKPDVVLLDMNMPRMDGPTTIGAIRSDPTNEQVKVIAVSGMSQNDAGVASGPNGVDRWFLKPIKPDMLAQEIHKELGEVPATV